MVIFVSTWNGGVAIVRIACGSVLMLMVMIHPSERKPCVVMIRTHPHHQKRGGEE